jgi:hypothetical protein
MSVAAGLETLPKWRPSQILLRGSIIRGDKEITIIVNTVSLSIVSSLKNLHDYRSPPSAEST